MKRKYQYPYRVRPNQLLPAFDSLDGDYPKSREGSTKKKSQVEKTTVRPKSAEPVIPVKSEHKSPKRTRPRAPKDLPVHGHGDLSGRKKAFKQSAEKGSPVGMKPRAVQRPQASGADDGKVWLKPDSSKEEEEAKGEETLVNGFASEDSAKMVNGDDYSVLQKLKEEARMNGEHSKYSRHTFLGAKFSETLTDTNMPCFV
ncbi:uncharacterized protein TNCV_4327981 [Trichonephila clavipes]|nr:uncharacterized protein TNCV_4327981 [Trichonephila clavipes]